jgi:hypothetical protein
MTYRCPAVRSDYLESLVRELAKPLDAMVRSRIQHAIGGIDIDLDLAQRLEVMFVPELVAPAKQLFSLLGHRPSIASAVFKAGTRLDGSLPRSTSVL